MQTGGESGGGMMIIGVFVCVIFLFCVCARFSIVGTHMKLVGWAPLLENVEHQTLNFLHPGEFS